MKKKNLLTLGALCLSLGLVVSSCNQVGTEGPTGPTGPTGPQGEPGVPGTNGKTYKDVIVIHDNNLKNGDVTQSVFFVTEGAHDSVTFTFTPTNPEDNVVVNFEINGQVVEDLDPSATSYTIEDADDYKGSIQVTGIEFTTVDKYGVSLLDDFVKSLCESDKSLNLAKTEGTTTTHFLGEGDDSEYVENHYSEDATDKVQAAYEDALEDLETAISDAKEDHKDDVAAQVEAIRTAEQAAEVSITEVYNEAIEDAKVQAESDLDDLAEVINDENYTDENRAADKAAIQANIDAATTIEGLGKVIDGPEALQDTEGASGNIFVGAKQKAFEEISDALEGVAKFTTELKNDSLLANLAVWGVDSTELPTTIAESYLDQISASTDITLLEDSKTHALYTQLGKDGADAIENSVLGVKDALLSAVKAKYEAEINDSKVLANQSATKTALLGVLETAISNFETADTNGTTFSITQYIGTDVKVSGTAGLDEGEANVEASSKKIINGQGLGLIGYVEYCLAQPVNGSTNQAWLAERISNAKTEVSKTLKTARDSISDEKYDSLASYTTKTVNNVTTYTPEEAVLGNGDISKEIDNPLFTWTPGTGDTKSATPKTSSVAAVSVSGTDTSAHYDLDEWLDTLSKATIPEATSSYDEKGNWIGGTLNVQSWAQGHVADFEKIYEEGLGLIKGSLDAQVSSAISGSGLTTTGYVSSAKVTESWDSLSPDTDSTDFATASEFINTADSISSNVSLLKTLNDGITSWLDETVDEDPQFKDYFGLPTDTDSVSDTRKAFEEELSAVLAGNVSSSSLNSWLRNLDSVYEDDVAGYLETAKDLLTQRYQEKVSRADTVEESRALTSVINSFNSFVGHKVKESNGSYVVDDAKGTFDFTCTTITNIFKWLNDGYASLTAHSIVLSAVNEENIDTKTPITGTDGITQFTNAASFKLEAIGDNAWKASGDTFALTESNFNAIGYGVGTECVAFSVDNLTAGNAAAVRWVSSVGAAFPESSPLLSYEKVEADGAIHVVAGLYGYVWNNGVTTEEEFSNEDTPVVLVRVWDDTEGKGSYTDYYFDFSSMFPAE